MKIRPLSAAVLASLLPLGALAQPHQPPAPVVKEAMAKLNWIVGEWRGEGWRTGPEGRETFQVAEQVDSELEGMLIVFHGRGWSIGADGEEIPGHKAFGVLSYDAYGKTYRFDAFVKEGYQSRTEPEVGENEYRWSHPAGPGARMRYHARLTDAGEWLETGERCVEETCTQFLEMTLKRVSE